jgi:soluble lytic murein transglycosylase-like protein
MAFLTRHHPLTHRGAHGTLHLKLIATTCNALRLMALDVRDGFVEITRNGFALLGLAVITALLLLAARPELRATATTQLLGWLEARQPSNTWSSAESFAALARTTAGDPLDLPAEQASVTYWLSRKYNVAPEPLSVLVAEAFQLGERAQIAPTLILAIMAVESNFNPFAQSVLGGQGLMQIQPSQQRHKLADLGGPMASFDPLSNLRIGVSTLHDLSVQNGSIEAGLTAYAEATKRSDSNYLVRVLQEEQKLAQITQSVRQARAQSQETPAKLRPARWLSPAKTEPISL